MWSGPCLNTIWGQGIESRATRINDPLEKSAFFMLAILDGTSFLIIYDAEGFRTKAVTT